jgi:iron(III) transport system permease protein
VTDHLATPSVDPLDATAPAPPPRRRGPRRASSSISPLVTIPAIVVAAFMLVPAAYLVVMATELPSARIIELLTAPETLRLAARTVGLAVAVTAASLLLGVPLAWLTVRSDLPGKRFFAVATALPLVIPTYVGAYAILAAFAPGGLVESWLGVRPPSPYGFVGAFAALTLFTYPYVLLTCQSAIRGIDPAFEEASRSLGQGPVTTFFRVTLPQLRPAAAAGGLLVSLYVLSDFGAVSMLRYSTFTRALYTQFRSAFDRAPAAVLGLFLVALTLIVLVVEARVSRDRGGQFRSSTTARQADTVPLRAWRWPAAAFATTVVTASLVVPITVVLYWLIRGLRAGEPIDLVVGAAGRSLLAALLGAVVATLAALPVGIWAARSSSRVARGIERLAFTGYALPGIVVALALVYVGIRVTPGLYQTLAMLVFAYVVLFLPQAVGAIRTSLLQVPPGVEEASRTLGAGRVRTLFRLVLPLSGRGAITGGALVFLTAMKELPATLLLAPTGYDTLAVRVWSATREAFFARAAAPALLLILLGSVPLAILTIRSRQAP